MYEGHTKEFIVQGLQLMTTETLATVVPEFTALETNSKNVTGEGKAPSS